MAHGDYSRYVALGDSQTEGLWDGDDSEGIAGFADRLAAMLDELRPGLRYANLAIRGRRIRDVLDDQLPKALAMRPDLISLCVGMNDITRPGMHFDRALTDLELLYERLAQSRATVVTTTFPDIARIVPIGRVLTSRVLATNEAIVTAGARHGFKVVDLYNAPSMSQPDVWSDDRVHGSTKGHVLFAAAAAEALELPDSNHDWAQRESAAARPTLRSRAYSQALWTKNMLAPWLWHHARGISSGDGREPKRPALESLTGQKPSSPSGTGDCPLATESITRGHRNEIASPVNIFAPPSDMPVVSATFAATSAAFWPGSDNIGHTDWPIATRSVGLVLPARPAPVTALRNASVVGSA